jgi:phage baseplate assembly protein W
MADILKNLQGYEFENNTVSNVSVQINKSPIEQRLLDKSKHNRKFSKRLGKIGANKDFEKVWDLDMIGDQLINILNINKGTYPYNPELGSDLIKYIFERPTEDKIGAIKNEVKRIVNRYFSGVYVENIVIEYIEYKKIVDINIYLKWEDKEKTILLSLNQDDYKYLKY